jgi:hypothetical protein
MLCGVENDNSPVLSFKIIRIIKYEKNENQQENTI